jgi:hypothetical protein
MLLMISPEIWYSDMVLAMTTQEAILGRQDIGRPLLKIPVDFFKQI